MASIGEALEMAFGLLGEDRAEEAATIARRILDAVPDHDEATHLLGLALAKAGRPMEAIPMLATAAARRASPERHANHGLALAMTGRVEEAIAAFTAARALAPDHPAAMRGLFELLLERGRRACTAGNDLAAIADLRSACAIDPVRADAAIWLGTASMEAGRREAAARTLRRALASDPASRTAWDLLARATGGEDPTPWRRAILSGGASLAAGDGGPTWRGWADALVAMGDPSAAAACRLAIGVAPGDHAPWTNLGVLSGAAGGACFMRAAILEPRDAAAHLGLAETALGAGDADTALREARKAVLHGPNLPEAELALFRAALTVGRFDEGWRRFEARWRVGAAKAAGGRPIFEAPRWHGGALDGPLLVWGEQGLGDEIMFASMLPELAARGLDLRVWVDGRLADPLRRAVPGLTILRRPDEDPRRQTVAAEIALGDLPALLRGRAEDFPAEPAPHLRPDPDRVAACRAALDRGDGACLIGVSWRTRNEAGVGRSIHLADLAAALGEAGLGGGRPIRLVSLQYGDVAEDMAAARARGFDVVEPPNVDPTHDIDGLAAVIGASDLTVTIDNATAHLAGALGGPCCVLLHHAADWRWMRGREDTPWYPRVRLFRQSEPGDWRPVLRAVTDRVRAALAGDRAALAPSRHVPPPPPDESTEAERERAKYEGVWRHDAYRVTSPGALQAERFDLPGLLRRHGAATALDAGCGSGKTTIHIMERGDGSCRMSGFDIAANCLDPFFDGFKGEFLTVGCLWRREDFADVYDAVICTDVLEHIPTDKVPSVLGNFRAVCRKVAFLGIALFDDYFGPAQLGEPLHLTVKPPGWWLERIAEAGFRVVDSEIMDHPAVGPAWLVVEAVPAG